MNRSDLDLIERFLPPTHGCNGPTGCSICSCYILLAEIRKLTGRVVELETALRPLAAVSDIEMFTSWADDIRLQLYGHGSCGPSLGDCRHAAAILQK